MNLVVIGAGPGGYVAAVKAAQLGATVTVVEREEVGGTCLNWGCIPTKALIASAEALAQARRLADFGIDLNGSVAANLPAIMERKNKIVATQIKGIRALFKNWNISLLAGQASLVDSRTVEVSRSEGTRELLQADRVILATGSRPAELPLFPFDGKIILSSNDAVNLSELPASFVIIGAGVIGCEFAFILREFGADVTIVEAMPRAVSTEDAEIAEILEKELKKKKIKLITNAKVVGVVTTETDVEVVLDGDRKLVAERVLISVGRAYNTEYLGLESLGISRGPRGEILVDDKMETNVPGIYAVGDVTGGMLLAHVASKEGIVAAQNACGIPAAIDYRVVPAGIFTAPEIGSVGLREYQAQKQGIPYTVSRFPVRGLGKAHAMGEIAGLFKIIAHAETDHILGVHIIGPHASDLIHEGALALQAGITAQALAAMIHAHPTLAEGIMEAAEDLHGTAIHLPKKN
ncbi:MAG TPA: dihydrolipoyl dehydrogenase [Dissulfurispiraceae bacterium]|nr:dihydrolipoyl dehydrogenase [Dissulfurispiraceae bacterium]